jgi:hypothetical protein
MAATVAATADSTVAAISVDEGCVAAGSWAQLAARTRTTVRLKARKARIVNSFLLIAHLRKLGSPTFYTYRSDQGLLSIVQQNREQ